MAHAKVGTTNVPDEAEQVQHNETMEEQQSLGEEQQENDFSASPEFDRNSDPDFVLRKPRRAGSKRKKKCRSFGLKNAAKVSKEVSIDDYSIRPEDLQYKICNNYQVSAILGVTRRISPELNVFVRYTDGTFECIPTRVLAHKAPIPLIKFYEKNIKF